MVKEYSKRVLLCFTGILFCGLACVLGVKAGGVGTNAWNTLALGIQNKTGLTFGTCSFVVSLTIVVIDLVGKGRLGFGSLINIIFVSAFSDMFLKLLAWMPAATGVVTGMIYTLAGQVLMSFATLLYMLPALGCGPRDTLMVLIGKKVPKIPIGAVRFSIEAAAMVVGILLGAPFGLGSVVVTALQASIFQFACQVTKIEPRNISHEDFAATLKRLR